MFKKLKLRLIGAKPKNKTNVDLQPKGIRVSVIPKEFQDPALHWDKHMCGKTVVNL